MVSNFLVINSTPFSVLIEAAPSSKTASRALLGLGKDKNSAPPCLALGISVKFSQIFSSSFQAVYGSFSAGGAFQFAISTASVGRFSTRG